MRSISLSALVVVVAVVTAAFWLGRASVASPASAAPTSVAAVAPGPTRIQMSQLLTDVRELRRQAELTHRTLSGSSSQAIPSIADLLERICGAVQGRIVC